MALQLVRGVLTVSRAGAEARAASEVKRAVRQRLVARLLADGPGGLQRTRTGTLQSTLVDGVETLDAYVGRFLRQVVAAVLGAAGVTAYLIILDPMVGSVVLACAVVTAVVPAGRRPAELVRDAGHRLGVPALRGRQPALLQVLDPRRLRSPHRDLLRTVNVIISTAGKLGCRTVMMPQPPGG